MTRYKGREYGGHALIAGFCEIGETGEDTVRREVMEEAGIHVKNIRYYKSQPWGFESDLLLGYFCEADGDEEIRMDDDELSEAVWIRRDEIQERFENMSLTNEMICHFKGEV
jgi:NAD+ diphosphatase